MATREAIYTALFDLIVQHPLIVGQFVTTGRFLHHHEDVSAEQMPALYMFETGEEWMRPGRGIPPKRTLQCEVIMYAFTAAPDDRLPATLANNMLDAIDDVLTNPGNPENVVTLGDTVYHVYIEGAVRIYEGLLQNHSIVSVPIRILIP